MIWDIHEYRWDKMYNLAKSYYLHHGNLDVPSNFRTKNGYEEDPEGFDLGNKIIYQREAYKESRLSKAREKKLNDIEMIWDLNEYRWNINYSLLENYYNHYNRKEKLEVNLDWIDTQRRKYRGRIKGVLTDKQIMLLEKLNFDWFAKKDLQYQTEIITSDNNNRKSIEIFNRFRSYLNNLPKDVNILSKEEINQGFIDQLNGKRENNNRIVTSLEEAIYETVKVYDYKKNSNKIEILIYYLLLHIDRMDQYEDAILCFPKNNGVQEYLRNAGKENLLQEIRNIVSTEHCDIDISNLDILYQEYSNYCYTKDTIRRKKK